MEHILQISDPVSLKTFFQEVRHESHNICSVLYPEDFCVQPGNDVSPPKWHLAHTTWFFETFLLKPYLPGYKEFDAQFNTLFNSYYETIGKRIEHFKRGDLSRPAISRVYQYRDYVDSAMEELFQNFPEAHNHDLKYLITIGLNHEQQHQELLLADIKYLYSVNLTQPAYTSVSLPHAGGDLLPLNFLPVEEGIYEVGYSGEDFCYDNEQPRHKVYINPFKISNRLITNEEFLEFIESGGYNDFRFWLSDGWDYINQVNRSHPLYWEYIDGQWYEYTLNGLNKLQDNAPVTHLNFYEADAFATWCGKRLPTEEEWEAAAQKFAPSADTSNLYEKGFYHPTPVAPDEDPHQCHQLLGDAWEWTRSAYIAYPGYQAPEGALGEYNGKFMVNQKVLRGGSCATPSSHIRYTYRNFFHPPRDWQFNGLRLAE